MSNEDNKVTISAEQFGSPDGERLPATDSLFTSGQSEDPDTDTTKATIEEPREETPGLPSAMKIVTTSLRNDPSYAWSWHCNIAMAARDEGVDVMVAQRLAARFLGILTTGVGETPIDTRTFKEYKEIEAQYNAAAKE